MTGETLTIDGIRYRVVYHEHGDYVFANGKRVVSGVGFIGVERL